MHPRPPLLGTKSGTLLEPPPLDVEPPEYEGVYDCCGAEYDCCVWACAAACAAASSSALRCASSSAFVFAVTESLTFFDAAAILSASLALTALDSSSRVAASATLPSEFFNNRSASETVFSSFESFTALTAFSKLFSCFPYQPVFFSIRLVFD